MLGQLITQSMGLFPLEEEEECDELKTLNTKIHCHYFYILIV